MCEDYKADRDENARHVSFNASELTSRLARGAAIASNGSRSRTGYRQAHAIAAARDLTPAQARATLALPSSLYGQRA